MGEQPLGNVVTGDLVGSDIVRSLTGAIGLLLALPLTTGLAALVVTHTVAEPDQPEAAEVRGRHGHRRQWAWR